MSREPTSSVRLVTKRPGRSFFSLHFPIPRKLPVSRENRPRRFCPTRVAAGVSSFPTVKEKVKKGSRSRRRRSQKVRRDGFRARGTVSSSEDLVSSKCLPRCRGDSSHCRLLCKSRDTSDNNEKSIDVKRRVIASVSCRRRSPIN